VGQTNPSAQAAAAFSASQTGPDITEALMQYPVSAAEDQMRQFAAVANECRSFPANDQGIVLAVTISREAFPSFGDQTIALRISAVVISADNQTVTSDVIAVRRGGTVVVVTNAGVPLNAALTRTVVSAAYAKLVR
jgi:hypothetical protein